MLQLKHAGGEYELTDRTAKVTLAGGDIKLGDQRIGEPGEYEVNNVEIVFGESAALVIWEHLQIAYVMKTEKPGTFEADQFSSSDVLIIADNLAEITKTTFDELMSAYDPKVVIVSAATNLEASLKTSLKFEENSTIKLSDANLPEEGRQFFLTP